MHANDTAKQGTVLLSLSVCPYVYTHNKWKTTDHK